MEEGSASAPGSAGGDNWARSLADGVCFSARRGLMIDSSWWSAEAARGCTRATARGAQSKPAEPRSMTFAPF